MSNCKQKSIASEMNVKEGTVLSNLAVAMEAGHLVNYRKCNFTLLLHSFHLTSPAFQLHVDCFITGGLTPDIEDTIVSVIRKPPISSGTRLVHLVM